MPSRKRIKAKKLNLFQKTWKLHNILLKYLVKRFLHGLLVVARRTRFAKSGFVLPTTVLLLIVLGLVVSALMFRSVSRTEQVIGEREQKVIYNTATPAIDRAKAKLEYLFKKDDRLPSGVPSNQVLMSIMLNDGNNGISQKRDSSGALDDIYTFSGETRLDLNKDSNSANDNAWTFQDENNGQTIAYSILLNTESGTVNINSSEQDKANKQVVRNGPIAGSTASLSCQTGTRTPEKGWYPVDSSSLRKSFQVDAFVVNSNPASRVVTTLEFQQDRQLDRGNKWGAWFRNDLEIFPGPEFNINGAMHTEGNLIVGGTSVTGYMLSSQNSCFYTQDASEITVAKSDNFEGQIVSGTMKENKFGGESKFHLFNGLGQEPTRSGDNIKLTKDIDSISQSTDGLIDDITLDPVALFTRNVSQSRNSTTWSRDSSWKDRNFVKKLRVFNSTSAQPYVDDTYRADNRYGPKPSYGSDRPMPSGVKIGDEITATGSVTTNDVTALTNSDPPASNSDAFGLDGYWERRARKQGLRLIVGQRLELGNAFGWRNNGSDPLNPPDATTLTNEQRQRRTLRDNLAAVQATAVYHYENSNGYFPLACLATTAHPGTATTLADSTNFQIRDFFTGKGTNGWEYAPPATSETTFATAIASSQPLGKALRNLAYFAGDPDGAFPAKQESSGTTVHPHPYLTMWGDFSNLRRVINKLDGGTSYAGLSIADKTYLHTASCTLGMLANNISNANASSSLIGNVTDLGEHIWQAFTDLSGSFCSSTTPGARIFNCSTIPPIERLLTSTRLSSDERLQALRFNTEQQIKLDRTYGFGSSVLGTVAVAVTDGSNTYNFNVSSLCNPASSLISGLFRGVGGGLDTKKAALAMICEANTKYPSLYYLFPRFDHDHDGNNDILTLGINVNHTQDNSEPYISDTYIKGSSVNGSKTYKALSDSDIAAIEIAPRATSDWVLPKTTTATGRANKIKDTSGSNLYVPFLDLALSNGREMMSVRVLDIDLDMLRKKKSTSDTWIPIKDGIVYAFREDTMREDGIARPKSISGTAAEAWNTYVGDPTNSSYRMNANTPKDPPVNADNGISPKPVDYYADPERRPYGFRLKNGSVLKRDLTGITTTESNINGLSFISDNPVYIQGNFNLHSTDSTTSNLIEEFDQKLTSDWSNPDFYTGRTSINNSFADPDNDTWRPTEILADAITILSNDYKDGDVEDAFTNPFASAASTNNTSYQNQNRPKTQASASGTVKYWVRENPNVNSDSPVKVSKNGFPIYCKVTTVPCPLASQREYNNEPSGETKLEYRQLSEEDSRRQDLFLASDSRVNAIFVSGIVPSQANQSYGGLHNFPRFNEHWGSNSNKRNLYISGAFLQLNFSTSAASPFDQDAWEPADSPKSDEYIYYYEAPNRRWGYDVGLQYAPAGPAARRFVATGNTRSEFYQELPVDDPYIKNLRCATFTPSGSSTSVTVDPSATGCSST